jgi:hypothetical protein
MNDELEWVWKQEYDLVFCFINENFQIIRIPFLTFKYLTSGGMQTVNIAETYSCHLIHSCLQLGRRKWGKISATLTKPFSASVTTSDGQIL